MKLVSSSLILLFVITLSFAKLGFTQIATRKYSRDDFPPEFVFGAGTSAYQYEGAVADDGRSPSIWDTFTHAGNMPDKSTGDVAADGYHKFKEDVKLMGNLGLEAYKFSISWSRLLPNGRGAVNPNGLKYYNDVINELVEHGVQPHITLYHLDLPQVLEDEYGGWLSPKIIDDFKEYADICFREFNDRVSHWTTIAEPNVVGQGSYDNGILPPQRCSYPFGIRNCSAGNSTVEPYVAVHNVLLAHAAVVDLFRTKYQVKHGMRLSFVCSVIMILLMISSPCQSTYMIHKESIPFDVWPREIAVSLPSLAITYSEILPLHLSHLLHLAPNPSKTHGLGKISFHASNTSFGDVY